MTHTVQEFQQRMRHDRAFRQRILAARKAGTLAETMAQEGCAFDLSVLEVHLPQVNTGIRAGGSGTTSCTNDTSCNCYCLI